MSNHRIDQVPLFHALAPHKNILIAGAGGGYDVFSGLPLYFRLKNLGHNVWLANYSFTDLSRTPSVESESPLVEVGPDCDGPEYYFPEKYLSRWLSREVQTPELIYTFKRCGVVPLQKAYQRLVEQLELDAIVLVDGGTDSLMRGDEVGLGTPSEDITSIAAVHATEVDCKLLTAIGFGVDTFHGVCHHYFLEAVAALTRRGHFLGAFSLLPTFEEVPLLKSLADYVHTHMPDRVSIVLSSILNATIGEFGDVHATSRTKGSQLYINPLMSLYWNFQLDGVAERCLYLNHVMDTEQAGEVTYAISNYRSSIDKKFWKEMPM